MPHTPGPWQAKLGRSMAFDVSIVNDDGHIVARTSESNGPLIAAAPELLDALRAVKRSIAGDRDCWCEIATGHPLVKHHSPGCIAARAALAKVTEAPR